MIIQFDTTTLGIIRMSQRSNVQPFSSQWWTSSAFGTHTMGVLEPVLKRKVNHVLCRHNIVALRAMHDLSLNALVHRHVPCVTEYLFLLLFEHIRRRDRAFWNVTIVIDVRGANDFNFQVWSVCCVNHLINKAK